MKTLEVFSGTQSFSKAVKRIGGDTTTLDLLPKFKPDIVCDVLDWDYTNYEPHTFDIVWCSPPCTEYSKAKTRGVRNLELADKLVARCFEIIDYLKPKVWIVENVGTGLLVKRMETIRSGLHPQFVDYCAYGKPYRKRTVIWSNVNFDFKLCEGAEKCPQMIGRKHKSSVGNGRTLYNPTGESPRNCWEKDEIPDALCDWIVQYSKK